jgi:hypothetical protein
LVLNANRHLTLAYVTAKREDGGGRNVKTSVRCSRLGLTWTA